MPSLVKTTVTIGFACGVLLSVAGAAAYGAEGAPVGAWRATNDCFLAGLVLNENGSVQAAYLSGERDTTGKWSWDGSTLMLTSTMFPEDKFAGHLAGEQLEADYAWHDADADKIYQQACIFERFGF